MPENIYTEDVSKEESEIMDAIYRRIPNESIEEEDKEIEQGNGLRLAFEIIRRSKIYMEMIPVSREEFEEEYKW